MRINLGDDEMVEIGLAPLIDCVFLLLIFFLVATTLKTAEERATEEAPPKLERILPLELPESAAALQQRQTRLLVIGVDQDGDIYLDAEKVSTATLHQRLRQAAAQNTAQRIRIDGDRRTPFQHIVHVLDLCQFEGLSNVGVHTRD